MLPERIKRIERFDEFGFLNDWLRDLDWVFEQPKNGKISRYPLTNLAVDKNGNIIVELALAGFDKDDIDIELIGDTLVITGEISEEKEDQEDQENIEYIQRHISKAKFVRKIRLHKDYLNGDIKAEFDNGLLRIVVSKKEQPRKLIEIK